MKVYVTFDTEMWTQGWDRLDAKFQASFDRYYVGRSAAGDYALPRTLEIMRSNGLVGVFFVETLFALRFGTEHLQRVTRMITDAGQDVQLHMHTEWVDEIRPPLLDDVSRKRQHLTYYTLAEQVALLGIGKRTLEAASGCPVTAFRAGSFAANGDTFKALRSNGIVVDSSLNALYDYTAGSVPSMSAHDSVRVIDGVASYRVTVFRDGFGRPRPAHVNACSFVELRSALESAVRGGLQHFVIVSHNFEMLRPGSSLPDRVVAARFEQLCRYLADHPDRYQVGPYAAVTTTSDVTEPQPRASAWATGIRHVEQIYRRLA